MKDFYTFTIGRCTMGSSIMDRKMGMESKFYLMKSLFIRGISLMAKKLVSSMFGIIKGENNMLGF